MSLEPIKINLRIYYTRDYSSQKLLGLSHFHLQSGKHTGYNNILFIPFKLFSSAIKYTFLSLNHGSF